MKKRIFKASAIALALGATLTFIITIVIFMKLRDNLLVLILCTFVGAAVGVTLTAFIIYYSLVKEFNLISNIITKSSEITSGKAKFLSLGAADRKDFKGFAKNINIHLNNLYNKIEHFNIEYEIYKSIINRSDQGIILVKGKSPVIINQKAFLMLGNGVSVNKSIKDFDSFCLQILPICDTVVKTRKSLTDKLMLEDNKKSIDIFASLLNVHKDNQGVLILLTDSTEVIRLQKMRDEFAANVTHELKTPLTSIIGFIELLKSNDQDEETRKYFYDVIYSESQRLFHLIDDMLLLSQVGNVNSSTYSRKCDIKEEIDETVKHLVPILKKNNINIFINTEPNLFVNASSIRLQQLFSNIIGNAIKYNYKNGKIYVESYKEKNNVIIKVKDTGIGIDPDHIDKIFERFFRSDKSRASEVPGTGLGLAISKDIVSMYNGEIKVDSQIENGSEFIISLPLPNR